MSYISAAFQLLLTAGLGFAASAQAPVAPSLNDLEKVVQPFASYKEFRENDVAVSEYFALARSYYGAHRFSKKSFEHILSQVDQLIRISTAFEKKLWKNRALREPLIIRVSENWSGLRLKPTSLMTLRNQLQILDGLVTVEHDQIAAELAWLRQQMTTILGDETAGEVYLLNPGVFDLPNLENPDWINSFFADDQYEEIKLWTLAAVRFPRHLEAQKALLDEAWLILKSLKNGPANLRHAAYELLHVCRGLCLEGILVTAFPKINNLETLKVGLNWMTEAPLDARALTALTLLERFEKEGSLPPVVDTRSLEDIQAIKLFLFRLNKLPLETTIDLLKSLASASPNIETYLAVTSTSVIDEKNNRKKAPRLVVAELSKMNKANRDFIFRLNPNLSDLLLLAANCLDEKSYFFWVEESQKLIRTAAEYLESITFSNISFPNLRGEMNMRDERDSYIAKSWNFFLNDLKPKSREVKKVLELVEDEELREELKKHPYAQTKLRSPVSQLISYCQSLLSQKGEQK